MDRIYTFITEETLTGARDRVLDDLNSLTNGEAERAIRYVSEFVELDTILREHKQRQEEQAAREKEQQKEQAAREEQKIKGMCEKVGEAFNEQIFYQ